MMQYRLASDYTMMDGASPYEIDAALTDFGFAMGPFQVSDLAGIDIGYASRQRRAPTRPPEERAVTFADGLYHRGWLGQKTGRGFYIYDEQSPKGRPDPEILALLEEARKDAGITPRSFTADEIQRRYMAAMINEAARVLEEGIARRASDIDTVLLTGYGFPAGAAALCIMPIRWALPRCWRTSGGFRQTTPTSGAPPPARPPCQRRQDLRGSGCRTSGIEAKRFHMTAAPLSPSRGRGVGA
ncbi:3-hydroxyacyl-CoA dehydrogenase family protein [Pannonibacter phragmitetus]|uniref:3-hydroxyacyl-CoA dehydrogenase family protein n=1 Tax=Pannonibacter phragmitetus TaxID=121719 RepID=UPI003D2EDFBF